MKGGLLLRLSRNRKIALAVIADMVCLPGAVALSFYLRLGTMEGFVGTPALLTGLAALLGPLCLWITGTYREITRYVGPVFAIRVVRGCALLMLALLVVAWVISRGEQVPRTQPAIFLLLSIAAVGGLRLGARWLLLGTPTYTADQRVAIFGAGAAGVGLHAALVHGRSHHVVAYFDDNPAMFGRRIRGVQIIDPAGLEVAVRELDVRTVLLALPSAGRNRRRQIVERLAALNVRVLTVPTLGEIADGSARVDQLRPVQIEDLLGRTPIAARPELMHRLIAGRSVLVTGAGGSIGSELCRKAIGQGADRLVILDSSEHALYTIEMELRDRLARDRSTMRLEAVLGSVCDAVLMEEVCRKHRIQTIYHAAAYKHVPIVERNESVGIDTNVFGTVVAAQVAQRCGVQAFILISTDKAVRPTSVMGASKRLAEMALQAMQATSPQGTAMSMVRFGNVLGSSGSVIPLFREQIARGGPVTVTDPRMVRYFMTIPEAADLVIQAGGMARGGEVFLLDMGDPVKIEQLARNMIRLAGRSVRDAENPAGDIEIQFTGMRPGEKLFEELLIDGAAAGTDHPSIRLASEPFIGWNELEPQLNRLRACVDQRDESQLRRLLTDLVRRGGAGQVDLTGSAATEPA
jgi:FlaA1/EpsC-like NDP-sugar epimerase